MQTETPPSPDTPREKPRYYYGWNIVGLSLLTSLFSIGIVFYTHGVFRIALIRDFGFSEGDTYDVYAYYLVAVALLSFFVTPRLIESYGEKKTILAGCATLTAGLWALGSAPNKQFFFFAFVGLLAPGTNWMGMIATRSALAYWFEARRAQALSIAAIGVTGGGIINVQLADYLIRHYDWRVAYKVFAVIVLLVGGPLIAFFWKDRPEDAGLSGEPASYGKAPPAIVPDDAPPMNSKEILTNGVFVRMSLSLGLASAAWGIILQSIISDLVEQGYSSAEASLLFMILAWVILVGKPILGPIGDRIDRKPAIQLTVVIQLLGVGFFVLSRFFHPLSFSVGDNTFDIALALALLLYGIGVGGCQPLYSAYTADLLGRQTFARASGVSVPLVLGCQLMAYMLNGAIIDRTHTLLWMWYLMAIFYVFSIVLLFFIPRADELGQRTVALSEAEVAPSVVDSELIQQRAHRQRSGR